MMTGCGFLGRAINLMFHVHMGNCDYFEYNGREFCIAAHMSHILFFPVGMHEALMRMPVNLFGVFGGIDVSHVTGAKDRCRTWALRRASTAWAAFLFLTTAALLVSGVFGTGVMLGFILLVPGILSAVTAAAVYCKKPPAPEASIKAYKELLQPLFPESDLPNLEPTALEAVTAILNGKELHNELGKALEEEKVNPAQVIDSCLLVHPGIAAGNHGSSPPVEPFHPEPRNSGHSRRPLLEGKVETPDMTSITLEGGTGNEGDGKEKPVVIQISPLARMLESIPEPCEAEEVPPGDDLQFCVTGAERDQSMTDDQWRNVASTLDKFLGPKASMMGRAILPPETALKSERGRDSLFLENTPVHDDSHVIYIETPSATKKGKKKGKRRLKELHNVMEKLTGKQNVSPRL